MARPQKIWFRKATGWWMIKINGKQTKLVKGKENKAQAQQKFHELMAQKARLPESADARVADVVEAFLKHSRTHFAEDTHRLYKFYCQSFAEACGNILICELKPYHISRWVDAKVNAGLWNETTVYNARRIAFRVFSWSKKEGMLESNPLQGMEKPKPQPRQRAMTPEEFWKLYDVAKWYFQDFLLGLQLTGARPKELRELTWPQIKEDRIEIDKHKTRKKVGKARVIMLTNSMKELLEKRRELKQEYVFTDSRGHPWNCNSIRQQMKRLKQKAGLPKDVCAYLVRHMFGTQAILNGVDVATLKEAMGHETLEMISKVYVHLSEERTHLQQAMEKVTVLPRPDTDAQDSTP